MCLLPGLEAVVPDAFSRREQCAGELAGDAAERVAFVCRDMATRFRRGGKLLVFGNGAAGSDAGHIAVEFMHPVTAGRRTLPAMALGNDGATVTGIGAREGFAEIYAHQLRHFAGGADIALGISPDGRCASVVRGLEVARELGLLTVALLGGDGGDLAAATAVDHALVVRSADPLVVQEVHVTIYHVLWELVHVFLERPGVLEPEAVHDQLRDLYPFGYAREGTDGLVLTEAARSTAAKAAEIVRLRREVADLYAADLSACAHAMAERFAAGGRLFTFGNGASSTDAQDMATTFLHPPTGRPLPALPLTCDIAVVTALSNDIGFEVVFARQIAAFGRRGDIVLGLSTSGGSPNIVQAFEEAARGGLLTIGMAGYHGGRLTELEMIDHLFVIPSSSAHLIQEAQTTLHHVLWELTQRAMVEQVAEQVAERVS